MDLIKVPSVKNDEVGYRKLLGLVSEIRSNPLETYILDFGHCSALDINAMAVLGMTARYIAAYNRLYKRLASGSIGVGKLIFNISSMNPRIRKIAEENNFLRHVHYNDYLHLSSASYIGYREHGLPLDEDLIVDHLRNHWLTDERLTLSKLLKQEIISRILEIYVNAYGHGRSADFGLDPYLALGAISCGHFDAKEKVLKLCVVDFGKGICRSVTDYFPDSGLSDTDALSWALQLGNSTHTDSGVVKIPRGLGFDLLREFVRVNNGCIRIYSNGACAVADGGGGYIVQESGRVFDGTIVDIKIKCDGRVYSFAGEGPLAPQQFF